MINYQNYTLSEQLDVLKETLREVLFPFLYQPPLLFASEHFLQVQRVHLKQLQQFGVLRLFFGLVFKDAGHIAEKRIPLFALDLATLCFELD